MSFPGAGAGWRATITRTSGKPSPSSSPPPSTTSPTCPGFILLPLAYCRGPFTAIRALASALIRADPVARMHLKRRGARADHLTPLAPSIARRTDGIKSASCCRQRRIARQRALPCCLTRRIDVKDHVAPTLAVEDPANCFRGPPICKALLLEERAEGF